MGAECHICGHDMFDECSYCAVVARAESAEARLSSYEKALEGLLTAVTRALALRSSHDGELLVKNLQAREMLESALAYPSGAVEEKDDSRSAPSEVSADRLDGGAG